jgi:uncharacterized OsmC-like protein
MMTQQKSVRAAQATLCSMYRSAPDAARVSSHASTVDRDPTDPFRATVFIGADDADVVPFGAERALGGPDGMPGPIDFVCAGLAASQDSNVRLAANRWGVALEALNIRVRGWVDVRGAIGVSRDVPVGLQSMECTVQLAVAEGTDPERVRGMLLEAEQSCAVLATLRRATPVYIRVERTTAGPVALAA